MTVSKSKIKIIFYRVFVFLRFFFAYFFLYFVCACSRLRENEKNTQAQQQFGGNLHESLNENEQEKGRTRVTNMQNKQTNWLRGWIWIHFIIGKCSRRKRVREGSPTLSQTDSTKQTDLFRSFALAHFVCSTSVCVCVKVKRCWRVAVWQNKWPRQTCVFIFRVTITHTAPPSPPSTASTCQVVSENFPQHKLVLFKHTYTHTDRYVVMSVYCTQLLAMIMIIKCTSQKAGLMLQKKKKTNTESQAQIERQTET